MKKYSQNGTHFELGPETGGPLPGKVLVRGAGTAAGMALRVQPQCTPFVFFHCKTPTEPNDRGASSRKPSLRKFTKRETWNRSHPSKQFHPYQCKVRRIPAQVPKESQFQMIRRFDVSRNPLVPDNPRPTKYRHVDTRSSSFERAIRNHNEPDAVREAPGSGLVCARGHEHDEPIARYTVPLWLMWCS